MTEIRVQRFDTPCALPAAVLRFWAEHSSIDPMRSPAWLLSWWRAYSENAPKKGCIYTVFHQDRPIAVAPFYVRVPVPGIRSLRLMGDKGICTDHASLIIDPHYKSHAIDKLAETLTEDAGIVWNTLCFEAVDLDDPNLNMLLRGMQQRKLQFSSQNAADCWVTELRSSWDEFLMSMSKNHRKRCRRWQKEYFDSGRAQVVEANTENWRSAWHRLVELNQLRRTRKCDKSAFDESRFVRCHQEFLENAISSGKASLRELYVDRKHVASEYLLLGVDVMYCYQSGMLTTDIGAGFGNLSLLALIRDACNRGYRQIDFLRGDEAYKQHWAAQPSHTVTWRASADCMSGNVYRTLREAMNLLRDTKGIIKTGLSTTSQSA